MPSGVSPTDAGPDGDTHKRTVEPGRMGAPCRRKAPAGWGGGGASGPCPEMEFGEYRFDTSRALRAAFGRKPSGRGVLTRSRSGPPAGGGEATPSGPRGRFQPAPVAPVFRPRGGVPAVRSGPPEAPSETPTLRRPGHPGPTRPADGHAPLDRPAPPVRSPAGRPPQRWGSSDYAGGFEGEDKFGVIPVASGRKGLDSLRAGVVYARGETRMKCCRRGPGHIWKPLATSKRTFAR
jgi:hypothetical protein